MSDKYAIGLRDITLRFLTPTTATVAEVDTLTLSSGATSSGDIKIFLDGVEYPISVTLGDTASDVADAIRLEYFEGWVVSGVGAEVVFTAEDEGYKDAPLFLSSGTGVIGSFVRTVVGEGNVFGAERSIGEVAEGSTQFMQEAPNETKFKGDYGDISLMTLFQMGDITLETDIIEVNGAKMAELTGAIYDPDTKTVSLPDEYEDRFAEVMLYFKQGFEAIRIKRAQVAAYPTGANMKSEMFKLHLKCVAVPDSGDFVDIVIK